MKILMVNKYLYYKGGAETYALKVGKYLEEQGNELQYFGMYSSKNIVKNDLNLYTQEMDFHTKKLSRILYPFKIIYSFEAKRKIKNIIKSFKPDVIHLNNINFQLTPSIIEIAKKLEIPVVQTVHDYQMICPNHLLFNPNTNQICEKCINSNKKHCIKNKCIHNNKIKSIIGYIENYIYTKILKTYSKVDKYICPSEFLESKLIEANPIYKGKTIAIHNYIELNEITNYEKEDYVLFFGRLSEEKGFKMFLEICKELENIKFKVAGTGPLESICKDIPNVEYVGFKTGKDLEEIIAKAKFSVYPSIWYENCPLSILESESLGTPVITANYGGMKELVEDGKTGILVDRMEKNDLKKSISNLYNEDSKVKEMSQNCIDARNSMISMEEYCRNLIGIYKEVVNKKVKSDNIVRA